MARQQKNLTPAQKLVLVGAWHDRTYASMANKSIYEHNYLKTTGARLWQTISDLLQIPIAKATLRSQIEAYAPTPQQQALIFAYKHNQFHQPGFKGMEMFADWAIAYPHHSITSLSRNSPELLEYPSGPVCLESPFYIERREIEAQAYQEISKPRSIIRIKAPQQMGKSSLLLRILDRANILGYQQVTLDIAQADRLIISDLDRFLRWFCTIVSQKLNLSANLEPYWQPNIGSKLSCTLYFRDYLLSQIKITVVLAINELNQLFAYPQVAQEFLRILRHWHEDTQKYEWQNLRLVLLYSTEFYRDQNLMAALNIGLPLTLTEFTAEQVEELAARHQIPWHRKQTEKLMAMVGGHPALVRLTFYHLINPLNLASVESAEMNLDRILELAASEFGIYRYHLHQLMLNLQKNLDLNLAFKTVLKSTKAISLSPGLSDRLESLGLVKVGDNFQVTVSCRLYRLYFSKLINSEVNCGCSARVDRVDRPLMQQLEQLQQAHQALKEFCHRDPLTHLTNQRGFELYIAKVWPKFVEHNLPVCAIAIDIDYFKIYDRTQGHLRANLALQKIAETIAKVVDITGITGSAIARFDREEFVILLPGFELDRAVEIAEEIREQVKLLSLAHDHCSMGGLPDVLTVSLGVAKIQADSESSPDWPIAAATLALKQSKKQGRDRTSVYQPE